MVDLDDLLTRLAAAPEPTRLAMIDDAVMLAVGRGAAPGLDGSIRLAALACVAALGLGVASIGLSVGPAQAAPDVLSIGSAAAMAPSTLLLGRP